MNNSIQSFMPQNQDMVPQKQKKGNEILAKVILGFFYISIIVVAVGCFYFFNRKISNFYIIDKEISLIVGNSYKTKLHVNQDIDINGEDSFLVSWTSSNPSVAEVDSSGVVIAKSIGMAEIKATLYDESESVMIVTVGDKKEDFSSMTLNFDKDSYDLEVGNSLLLSLVVTPTDLDYGKVTWSSDNTKVATVDDSGMVIAKSNGTALITAKLINGESVLCKVVVSKVSDTNKLKIVENNKTITVSEKATLKINKSDKENITWISSNPEIVEVDSNGTIFAKDIGIAVITAVSDNGSVTTSTITVIDKVINVESITLNKTEYSMYVGATFDIVATVLPEKATNKTVTWKSSNTKVAVVNNGVVTAKSSGKAVITASSSNGKTAKITIEVKKKNNSDVVIDNNKTIDVSSIVIDKSSSNLYLGETLTLKASISPSDATNKNITWSTSNSNIATVNNGVVTPVSTGTVIITASSNNGKKATSTIRVIRKTIDVSSISLNKQSVTLTVNDSITLTASINPSNATNKSVTWKSSNTSIATINNGVVTAKAAGTATITAISSNGKQATCNITVTKSSTQDISLNTSSVNLNIGNTYNIVATISNTTNKTLTWSSNNTSVATVDNNGLITAKRSGNAIITVTNGSISKTVSVTVNGSRAHFINLGKNADAILLESNGNFAMVDTGLAETSTKVLNYLTNLGVNKLDFVIITHPHSDHNGGIEYMLQNGIKVSTIYLKTYTNKDNIAAANDSSNLDQYNRVINAAKKYNVNIVYVDKSFKDGQIVKLGGMQIYFYNVIQRVLNVKTSADKFNYDTSQYWANQNENINSILNLVRVNNQNMILTADLNDYNILTSALARANSVITNAGQSLDVYKVVHHGNFNCTGRKDYSISAKYYIVTNNIDAKSNGNYKITNDTIINDGTAVDSCFKHMKLNMCDAYYANNSNNALVVDFTNSKTQLSGGGLGRDNSSRCK